MSSRSAEGGAKDLQVEGVGSGAQGGVGGVGAAGGKPEPAHLATKGPCTFTKPSLLIGINRPQEEQVPLMERPSVDITSRRDPGERDR